MIKKIHIKKFIYLLLFMLASFSVNATLNRDQALDFVWRSKLPHNYLENEPLREQRAIISSITKINERLEAHTRSEMNLNYDDRFPKYSNYLIWGFIKYFKTFTNTHELYQDYTWKLSAVLSDQTNYLERFSGELLEKQVPKYKTGIARGYLELTKLDPENKHVYLETAWNYFSNIQGNISKKIKHWKAEIIYNDYIPEGMTELEALNFAAALCNQVQEKQKSTSKNSSPKGGSKAEGKIPHHNYLIYKENQNGNDELLNLINQKIQNINNNAQNDDSGTDNLPDSNNNDSSDDSDDDFSDRGDNEFPIINFTDEDNHQEPQHFNENEHNEMLILRDNGNLEESNEDEENSLIIDFDAEEFNEYTHLETQIKLTEDEDEFIFTNTKNNNKSFVIEDDELENSLQNKKRKLNKRGIVDINIAQFPQDWVNIHPSKNNMFIIRDYWTTQKNTILKMAESLEERKTVRINSKKEYFIKSGDGIAEIRRKIGEIYNWEMRHAYEKLEILQTKKRTEWNLDEVNTLRSKAEEEKCGIEELKTYFRVGDEKIKRICKENNITIFEKENKKKRKNEVFHWTLEKINYALKLKKENSELSGTKIAEKIKEKFKEIPTPQSVNQILKKNQIPCSDKNELKTKKPPEPWEKHQIEELVNVFKNNPQSTYATIGKKLHPVRAAGTVGKKLRELRLVKKTNESLQIKKIPHKKRKFDQDV